MLMIAVFRFFAVTTGSMRPAINEGSLCAVNTKTPFEDIVQGDVIVFRLGELRVTHRVAEVTDKGLVTKGDANNNNDSTLVDRDNYIGKNVFTIPGLGVLMLMIRTRKGMILTIAAIIAVTAAGMLLDSSYDDGRRGEHHDKIEQKGKKDIP